MLIAGADIKEMQPLTFSKVYGGNFLGFWNSLATFDKPLIAAVNGFAVSFQFICFNIEQRWHMTTVDDF